MKPSIVFNRLSKCWKQRKCGDVFTESREFGHSGDVAKKLTVKLWGKGVYAKLDQGSANTHYFIRHTGQFIYSKLDFLNSAFGVVNEALDGYESTADMPAFDCHGVNPYFMYYRAIQPSFYITNGMIADGSRKAKRVHAETFLQMPLMLPSIEEQDKIAWFFRKLEDTITIHQRKINSMKRLKKSLLQKMFPQNGECVPEIRFSGFTDSWEQRKFEDIAKRRSDSTISSNSLPCVEYEDVISEQGTLNKDISQKELAKTGIEFESGDVLFGKLRPYLKNWLLPDFNGVAVGDWWVLKPVSTDGNFLYRLIQTSEFMSVANVSSGSKMPRSDWALVSKTYFSIPPDIAEQQKIGAFFRDIDNTITLHQRKVESLQKLKKSLLKQMFV